MENCMLTSKKNQRNIKLLVYLLSIQYSIFTGIGDSFSSQLTDFSKKMNFALLLKRYYVFGMPILRVLLSIVIDIDDTFSSQLIDLVTKVINFALLYLFYEAKSL